MKEILDATVNAIGTAALSLERLTAALADLDTLLANNQRLIDLLNAIERLEADSDWTTPRALLIEADYDQLLHTLAFLRDGIVPKERQARLSEVKQKLETAHAAESAMGARRAARLRRRKRHPNALARKHA